MAEYNPSLPLDDLAIPDIPDAIRVKGETLKEYILSTILNSAPGTLDTLKELAAALGDDPNFATTITNLIAQKVASSDVSVLATANMIAKRDTAGALAGDITGNAAGVAWTGVSGKPTFASVATSGSYADLSNKPAIPSATAYDSAHLFAQNGYQKLSNGLLLQWGISTETPIVFPISFLSTCFGVVAGQGDTTARGNNVGVANITLTGCELRRETPVYWFAIGY